MSKLWFGAYLPVHGVAALIAVHNVYRHLSYVSEIKSNEDIKSNVYKILKMSETINDDILC